MSRTVLEGSDGLFRLQKAIGVIREGVFRPLADEFNLGQAPMRSYLVVFLLETLCSQGRAKQRCVFHYLECQTAMIFHKRAEDLRVSKTTALDAVQIAQTELALVGI